MTFDYFLWLAVGAAAGGFINGLAGFGTALFTLGFWLQIMQPEPAVSIIVIMSVTIGLQGAWVVRHAILQQPRRLLQFLVPGIAGIPIGVAALSVIEPHALKITIASIMVLYGGFFSLRRSLPKIQRPTPVADGFVGFLGGILGGAASLSGVLPTMWCSMRAWSKSEMRAVLQPFNISILAITAAVLFIRGNYTWNVLVQVAIALPIALIFAQLGLAIFKRLKDDHFRRLLILMMFVSGVVLMLKEVL